MKLLLRTVLLLIGMVAFGSLLGNTSEERLLKFYHTHTGDSLQVVYFRQGEYDPGALADIPAFRRSSTAASGRVQTYTLPKFIIGKRLLLT